MRRVCVFLGSSPGTDVAATEATFELGSALAAGGIGLVYGGATVGLMGLLADTVMDAGGDVVGVIPDALRDREIAHSGLSELHLVVDMHERKKKMYELADGFIALPGGLGTLEEIFEAATWSQLGLHVDGIRKPVVLLDAGGFWAPIDAFLDRALAAGFVKSQNRSIISTANSAVEAIAGALGRDPHV